MVQKEELAGLRIDKAKIPRRSRSKKRFLYVAAVVLFLAALAVLYQQGHLGPKVRVQLAIVQKMFPSQAFTLLNASGYVVAQRKAAVAAKITGRLVSLTVEEGSRVKKGQVIARLENRDAIAARDQAQANVRVARFQLEQARANLRDARLSYERKQELVARGYISRAEFDAAEARYKSALAAVAARRAALTAARAALAAARAMLDYTYIRAPFDAVVLTKNADIGDIVTPVGAAANAKAAVVTIADMTSLQVEADVSESNIEQVKVGQPCEIKLDAFPDVRFRGVVHMIVPTAERSKAAVTVKVAFLDRDPRILPEMSAMVSFLSRPVSPAEQRPVKAVPAAAILSRNGRHMAYLVRDNRTVATTIHLGRRFGSMYEVLNGLEVGDKVVLQPLARIRNGVRVEEARE